MNTFYSNSELIKLQLSGERGIYLIELKADGKTQHYKIVKH